MSDFIELTCPVCKEGDFDEIGMSLHFQDCEKASTLRQAHFESECQRQLERLARLRGPDRDEWKHEGAEQQRLK